MFTADFVRKDWKVTQVNGKTVPEHLKNICIPPAWKSVQVDPDPEAFCVAKGKDEAGRNQRLYSPAHKAAAKSGKFQRVKALLLEWPDIKTQIEADLNDSELEPILKEAALVAYLIYETGIRPGSGHDNKAQVKAYGATTLQVRHIKPCIRGVRLKFLGKKAVRQNVLVTNPYLVRVLLKRKAATLNWSAPLFKCSHSSLYRYFQCLGSGDYTAKDFRTAVGTKLALELLGNRKRLPKSRAARRRIANAAIDKVAKKLGNTRSISRSAYVEPSILDRFIN